MPNGEIEELQPEEGPIEEEVEGGVLLRFPEDETSIEEVREFYANIIEDIDPIEMNTLVSTLLEEIERDKKSREKRDKQYDEAIKRTGLGKEAPGGADFEGASKAVHPILTEACVDFAARTIQELLPANGPVKTQVPGERPEQERIDKADRKSDYMNWQFMHQMPDFRTELEQLLTQLPLGGSQYLRLVWDGQKKRPVPVFVPIDSVYLPYAASNFYTAERVTFAESITRQEFETRVRSGMYIDIGNLNSAQMPQMTEPEKSTDRIEGKDFDQASYNEDGLRMVYEIALTLDIEEDFPHAPYLLTIDENSKQGVSLVRNWEETDDTFQTMFWMIEFPFVPWRGAYSIGLGQMIGSLAGGATGALRALLDSAHMNNMPTLLRLKGANTSGQSKELNVAEVTEVEGGIAGDGDIRKLMMAVPFNPPSPVLFQLLGFLVDAGRGVVRTTFDFAEHNPNVPVGTTLALIEEGMKVMSSIYGRLYHAMSQVFLVLHRINRLYLEDEEVKDDIGEMLAYRSDFELPLDVIPVANPQVFSDTQRMAQLQVIADRATQFPQIYDLRKVETKILEQTKIPNPEEFLLPLQQPEEQNAVNENATMTLGRPVAAFPEQDHLAHLQVHLDYLTSPMFGQFVLIAPRFVPMCLEHIKEHMTLWYVNQVFEILQQSTGRRDEDMKRLLSFRDPDTRRELDRTLAAISQRVTPQAQEAFQHLPPIIQQAMQLMESLTPKPEIPIDPNQQMALQTQQQIATEQTQARMQTEQMKVMAKQQETQTKLAADQQSDQAKILADQQEAEAARQHEREMEFMDLNATEQRNALEAAREEEQQAREYAARLEELYIRERGEDKRKSAELESRERMNESDNQTAMTIAAAEIASGEKVAVQSGTGVNPNPSD